MRISGTAPKTNNTKAAAEHAEREAIHVALHSTPTAPRKEVPTYDEWFNGRFWKEWVIAERNKPSERRSKEIIFRVHLKPELGDPFCLDEINAEQIQKLRAKLVDEKGLSDKRINNVMVVLSEIISLRGRCRADRPRAEVSGEEGGAFGHRSVDVRGIQTDPRRREERRGCSGTRRRVSVVKLGRVIGEIRALRWREDVDLVGGQLTVNTQLGNGRDDMTMAATRHGEAIHDDAEGTHAPNDSDDEHARRGVEGDGCRA